MLNKTKLIDVILIFGNLDVTTTRLHSLFFGRFQSIVCTKDEDISLLVEINSKQIQKYLKNYNCNSDFFMI